MAKPVKKAEQASSNKPKAREVRAAVSGAGYSKTFSEEHLKKIERKRAEMRARLFASG